MESKIERLAKYTPKGTLLPQKRSIYETKKRLIRAGGPSTNLREDPKQKELGNEYAWDDDCIITRETISDTPMQRSAKIRKLDNEIQQWHRFRREKKQMMQAKQNESSSPPNEPLRYKKPIKPVKQPTPYRQPKGPITQAPIRKTPTLSPFKSVDIRTDSKSPIEQQQSSIASTMTSTRIIKC